MCATEKPVREAKPPLSIKHSFITAEVKPNFAPKSNKNSKKKLFFCLIQKLIDLHRI